LGRLRDELAAAVGWTGTDLGGLAAAAGEEEEEEEAVIALAAAKQASQALKGLWKLGAKLEWLPLVEKCGLDRLLKVAPSPEFYTTVVFF
jgi:hypothetical protein